jgi:hypothetical protein
MLVICVAVLETHAVTRYVDAASATPQTPYTNWATAATAIQDAVDIAGAGDEVLVASGTYAAGGTPTPGHTLSNRVVITKHIAVRSVHGPTATIIAGIQGVGNDAVGAMRCVFMTAGVLDGFMLSNGHTLAGFANLHYERVGGGLWLTNGCMATNCYIQSSSASWDGGGVYFTRGGLLRQCTISNCFAGQDGGGGWCSFGGALLDCTITDCRSDHDAGGIMCTHGGVLSGCTLAGNRTDGYGGGAHCYGGGAFSNCLFHDNTANTGGGLRSSLSGMVYNCMIVSNDAWSGGGGLYLGRACRACNAIVHGNEADDGGGVYARFDAEFHNCTICGNFAYEWGGGAMCSYGGQFYNTIIYGNEADTGGQQWHNSTTVSNYHFCCLAPLPGDGVGNFTNAPLFLNAAVADYHLTEPSPCIDTGTNLPWMASATDIEGNPRILDGRVDVGAYEFVPEPGGWVVIALVLIYRRNGRLGLICFHVNLIHL